MLRSGIILLVSEEEIKVSFIIEWRSAIVVAVHSLCFVLINTACRHVHKITDCISATVDAKYMSGMEV